MRHDIENPERPAEVGVTGSSSEELTVELSTGTYVLGTVGPYAGRQGFGREVMRHRLTLPRVTTRERMIAALLDAARALGWKGDIPDRLTVQVDSGNAEFEPRQFRYKVRTGVWIGDKLAVDVRP
jgi:hypothetical protein